MLRTIAIDGPAASGKTVVGKRVAQSLGFWFLDTGIMYRAVTWLALEHGVSPDDPAGLGRLTEAVRVQPVSMEGSSVEVSGRRVGTELREPRVDGNVSNVSKHPVVRRALVEQQRAYAESVLDSGNGRTSSGGGIVMIGRDIGTVVLPSAELKVYLTASAAERARRRCQEILARGQSADLAAVLGEIEARDAIDSSRDDSPLRPAQDAWQLDTSDLSIDEVVDAIISRVEGR
jgi:cytidylate kinase